MTRVSLRPTTSDIIAFRMWDRVTTWLRTTRTPLLIALGSRGGILLVAYLGLQLLGPVAPNRFLLHGGEPHPVAAVDLFQRWDSYWFLNIARNGYRYHGAQEQVSDRVVTTTEETNITPFPLYPALSWLAGRLLGDISLAGLLVSLTCYLVAALVFFNIVARQDDRSTAARALLYLSIYPTGFIYNAIYSESLFLLLVLLALREARAGHALRAGLSGMGASLTRLSGAMLAPCVLLELVAAAPRERRGRVLALGLGAVALVTTGWIAYFLYLRQLTGSFWTYFVAQRGWHKELVLPWEALRVMILGLGYNDQHLLNLAAVALFVPLAIVGLRRLSPGQALLLGLGVLMPLCSSYLLGLPRYLMVLFPAFVLLARWGRSAAVHSSILVGFSLLHVVVMLAWLRWQYSL
jgi:hypothetical protein